MDISDINNIGHAWASWKRDEANKGKGVRSKGWVTKEQMRKNAAQKTLGIMIAVAVLTVLSAIFIKIFGKAIGVLMMVVLALGLPICWFIQENFGYNVQWLPLWIVGFALLLKICTKVLGRKWGLRIGVPIVIIIGLATCFGPNDINATKKKPGAVATMDAAVDELIKQIEANTDPMSAKPRVERIRKIFRNGKIQGLTTGHSQFCVEHAYQECLALAKSSGWIKNNDGTLPKEDSKTSNVCISTSSSESIVDTSDKESFLDEGGLDTEEEGDGALNTSNIDTTEACADPVPTVNETASAEAAQYLIDMSARLDELFAQIRLDKKPTTADYELDSRVEYLKNMYEQELRCTPYDNKSLSETKAVADKAYRLINSYAHRMHWIKSEEEKRIEQEVAAYLKDVSEKLGDLCAQVRANKKPTTPDYELNSRVEYLKGMFDREMRFPLRDRWNSVEEAKLHADKAYKTCLDHALRMGWIDGMSYIK